MRKLAWVLVAIGLACADPLTLGVDASCIAVLRFDGAWYGPALVEYQNSFEPTTPVGEVQRNLGCNDQPSEGDPPAPDFTDGDSNFLPAGTVLYAVEGFAPSERLAVRPDTVWILLESGVIE